MNFWQLTGRGLANVVRVGTLFWLTAHILLTLAYVMPMNPVKTPLKPLLDRTINTYFQQNWSLFAPNPVSSDTTLLARPLSRAEVAALRKQGLPKDGWYDLSMPLWTRFQQNRFSAYDRLVRPATNSIRSHGGSDLGPWWDACRKGDKTACKYYEARLRDAREKSGRVLAKIGSAFCKDVARPGQEISHVALRVRETKSVPWSKRYTGKPVTEDRNLGVYPFDPNAVTTGMYHQ